MMGGRGLLIGKGVVTDEVGEGDRGKVTMDGLAGVGGRVGGIEGSASCMRGLPIRRHTMWRRSKGGKSEVINP